MVDENFTFGLELLQSLYDSQITKKEDLLILFVHWYLIKNSFRNIGLGDCKSYNETEKGSELLPQGWSNEFYYALRYIKDKKLYILYGTKSDEDLLLNLLRTQDQGVSNVQFQINQTVTGLHGPIETLIPSHETVTQALQNDLLNPIIPKNAAKASSTQTERRERSPMGLPGIPRLPGIPSVTPQNVGNRDLYPLAQDGGGMVFDHFRSTNPRVPGIGIPGRLPPGAVPPHARFDPFGPPDPLQPRPRPRDPDSDYNDMFL